jgi:hypothetical protein
MATFPIIMGTSGYIPQTPASLQQQLLSSVAATNPGYTANLPGTLIEDISSTDVAALLQCDSSVAEIINSLTPYGANEFLLNQLGNLYGVLPQVATNTSVNVVFTGPPGFVIATGFVVGDGNYQYVVQAPGGIIGAGGNSLPLYAVANTTGTWAVPAGSVTELVTSAPVNVTLTVNNPEDGTPSAAGETVEAYRTRVLQAGYAPGQGMLTYLKTLLGNVPGVASRLISVRQVSTNPYYWEVICGGGDQYQVAFAIFSAGLLLTSLTGSVLSVSGITNATQAVVTTTLNHGYTTGQVAQITGATGMTAINNINFTVTVLTPTTFSINVDTTTFGAYTGGGSLTPNLRNVTVPVYDYPDTYQVTYVNPPLQQVAITAKWNTIATNYISPVAVAQLAQPAIVDYINGIVVGQPINLMELNTVFQTAVASLLPAQLLTRLVFTVSINGNGASPLSGTYEIPGDPESYFYTTIASVTVTQG